MTTSVMAISATRCFRGSAFGASITAARTSGSIVAGPPKSATIMFSLKRA